SVNKHLLTVYDKPMIYYPLSVLMIGGINVILLITTESEMHRFKELLVDVLTLALSILYEIQYELTVIVDTLIISAVYIVNDDVTLILRYNIFYGQGFTNLFCQVIKNHQYATVFGYRVKDPERFGVVEFDDKQNAISIEEKPDNPKSDFAITGLYIFDNQAVKFAKEINFSDRKSVV